MDMCPMYSYSAWCFQSMTTLVHQLAFLASKGRPSFWCHCNTDSLLNLP